MRHIFCDLEQKETLQKHLYDKNGYPILECLQCGLITTQIEPGNVAFDEIYNESYFEGGQSDGYAAYGASKPVIAKQARRILNLLEAHKTGSNLLEIGCAYGFFLEEAARTYDTLGIDFSEHAVHQAKQRGLNAIAGTIEKAGLPADSFDAVAILETIEHLPSPYAVFKEAARVSRKNAVMVVSTGDIESRLARWCGKYWRLMTPPQHLYYFSKKTLSDLARRTGWEPMQIEYFWRDVPLGLACYQLTSRLIGLRKMLLPASLGLPVNLYDVMTMVAIRR